MMGGPSDDALPSLSCMSFLFGAGCFWLGVGFADLVFTGASHADSPPPSSHHVPALAFKPTWGMPYSVKAGNRPAFKPPAGLRPRSSRTSSRVSTITNSEDPAQKEGYSVTSFYPDTALEQELPGGLPAVIARKFAEANYYKNLVLSRHRHMKDELAEAIYCKVDARPQTRRLVEQSEYPFQLEVTDGVQYDPAYPGTAVDRLSSVVKRVKELPSLDGPWVEVRSQLLAAGGLKEDRSTSHAFNDDNHCDLTTMVDAVSFEENSDGAVAQISRGNLLGPHIAQASLKEHGPGGSWSTCTNGPHLSPPSDVAHVQFSARVAFKLVWVPPAFTQFVLVDDEGSLLNHGTPSGELPDVRYRQGNYALVQGGKYATVADGIAGGEVLTRRV